MSEVDIIVPVHNAVNYAIKTLDAVTQTVSADYRIIVADDASDIMQSSVLADFCASRGFWYMRSSAQQWFSANVNRAVRLVTAPYHCIINSDLELTDCHGWLDNMLTELAARPHLAVLGCVQFIPHRMVCHTGFVGHDTPAQPDGEVWLCDWVTGAVWLRRTDVAEHIGPLRTDSETLPDGRIRDYKHFESDREWCFRARQKGFSVGCSKVEVGHYWRKSTPESVTHT